MRRLLSIYWLLVWRGQLGGAVIGGLAGFAWGMVVGQDKVGVGALVGAIAGIPWSFFVLQMALRKKYLDFRIVLEGTPAPPVEVPLSLFNKALVGALIAMIVLAPLGMFAINAMTQPAKGSSQITKQEIYNKFSADDRARYRDCFDRSNSDDQRRSCWDYYSRNYR